MSNKRIFFNEAQIDKELFKLAKNKDIENKLHLIVKKALKEIVSSELTSRQKQFIVLYYYKNNTMSEIAKLCCVNVSTVSRTLRRARKNILNKIKYYFVRIDDEDEYTDI